MAEGRIKLEISQDKMQAHLTIPGEEKFFKIKIADILNILKANKIVTGYLEESISKLVAEHMFNRRILVAQGRLPEVGEDAKIVYRFKDNVELAEIMKADGRDIKLFEIEYIQSVVEGQEIAIKEGATDGIPGSLLTGEKLSAEPGKDIDMHGTRVRISQDGSRMLADENGQVIIDTSGNVEVIPLLVVAEDVDRTTGNIDFDGSILVKGSVRSDFTVKASQHIEVCGNVGRARIEAGGDVFIKGGIQGKGEAYIVAGNNVATKFVESAHVIAGGNMLINGHVMNCTIEARHDVISDGKKATIVGGLIRSFSMVRAAVIGSREYVATRIELASSEMKRHWEAEQKELVEPEILASYEMLKKIRVGVETLHDKKKEQGGVLFPKETAYLERLLAERDRIQSGLEVKLGELEKIKIGPDVTKMEVRITGTIYSGVNLQIGDVKEDVNKTIESVRFIRYGDAITPERL